jgi:hypothetical protein
MGRSQTGCQNRGSFRQMLSYRMLASSTVVTFQEIWSISISQFQRMASVVELPLPYQ